MDIKFFKKIVASIGVDPKEVTVKTRSDTVANAIYFRHRITLGQYIELIDSTFWNGEDREFDAVIHFEDDEKLMSMFEKSADSKVNFLFIHVDGTFSSLLVSLWDADEAMLDGDILVKGECGGFSMLCTVEDDVEGVAILLLGKDTPKEEFNEDLGLCVLYNPDEVKHFDINPN